jgi:DNA polymerase III subunit epsilon
MLRRRRRRAGSPAAIAYARAGRPALNTPWRRASYAVVDLEMTGLDPRSDEIISFAAVPIDDGRIAIGDVTTAVARPERMPPPETIRIHGLRPHDLIDAPPLDKLIELMLTATAGRIIVAHPARVERAFLSAAFGRVGVKPAEPMICTARIAAHALALAGADRAAEVPLGEAARALGLPIHRPHHADGDALTTAQLFLGLVARLEQRDAQTIGSLARLSKAQPSSH